jgi:hypothetical protein
VFLKTHRPYIFPADNNLLGKELFEPISSAIHWQDKSIARFSETSGNWQLILQAR